MFFFYKRQVAGMGQDNFHPRPGGSDPVRSNPAPLKSFDPVRNFL
jgi:hypothetical protein